MTFQRSLFESFWHFQVGVPASSVVNLGIVPMTVLEITVAVPALLLVTPATAVIPVTPETPGTPGRTQIPVRDVTTAHLAATVASTPLRWAV